MINLKYLMIASFVHNVKLMNNEEVNMVRKKERMLAKDIQEQ
ncbi:hypothetical protein AGMMS49531_08770 [Endomicrobiia bacterium]|nr:hypothetical protein AGMMS49531_08770 [Endomicrobiia bacterium]